MSEKQIQSKIQSSFEQVKLAITPRFQLAISQLVNIKPDACLSKNWLKCTFDRSLGIARPSGNNIPFRKNYDRGRRGEKYVSPIDIGCKISCVESGGRKTNTRRGHRESTFVISWNSKCRVFRARTNCVIKCCTRKPFKRISTLLTFRIFNVPFQRKKGISNLSIQNSLQKASTICKWI